jgi:hypothetical protein
MRSMEWQLGILGTVRVFTRRDRRMSFYGRSCFLLKIELVPRSKHTPSWLLTKNVRMQ